MFAVMYYFVSTSVVMYEFCCFTCNIYGTHCATVVLCMLCVLVSSCT